MANLCIGCGLPVAEHFAQDGRTRRKLDCRHLQYVRALAIGDIVYYYRGRLLLEGSLADLSANRRTAMVAVYAMHTDQSSFRITPDARIVATARFLERLPDHV